MNWIAFIIAYLLLSLLFAALLRERLLDWVVGGIAHKVSWVTPLHVLTLIALIPIAGAVAIGHLVPA